MSVSVREDDFDIGEEWAAVAAAADDPGAVVGFTGLVRSGARQVEEMTLEHYPGMTETALADIEAEAWSRWPLQASRIIHRVGPLRPGERIVLVLVASAHRRAAFEAAEFLMDYLKTRAPFWKHERGADGAGWVKERATDTESAARWERDGGSGSG